jgi:hypothetical protein
MRQSLRIAQFETPRIATQNGDDGTLQARWREMKLCVRPSIS